MTDERTPTDFALEFAEYMAKGAEAFIAAVCKQQRLQQQFEEGEGPDPLTMQDADEGVSEYMRGLTDDIYEFRKRRDRAALSAPAVPEAVLAERKRLANRLRYETELEGFGCACSPLRLCATCNARGFLRRVLAPLIGELDAAPQPQEQT